MEELDVQTKTGTRKAILIRVDDDLLRTLKHVAVDLNRSVTDVVDEAVRFWLIEYRRNEKDHRWASDE